MRSLQPYSKISEAPAQILCLVHEFQKGPCTHIARLSGLELMSHLLLPRSALETGAHTMTALEDVGSHS